MPTETAGRYEMLWDCPRCDTKKLLGLTHRHCPNCGAPQDPARRYFPSEEEQVAVGDHPYHGADKLCAGCDTPNAAIAGFCVNCGNALDDSKDAALRKEQRATSAFGADSSAAAVAERKAPPPAPVTAPSKGRWMLPLGALGCIGSVVIGIVVVVLMMVWKEDAGLTVSALKWERSIAVETYGPKTDTGWKDQVPAAARGVTCSKAERSTRQVADGETCENVRVDKGDGTFESKRECHPKTKSEAVYDDKCSWTMDTWTATDTKKTTGAGASPAPAWPVVKLAQTGTCVGCQREGARKETYTVEFKDDAAGETRSCDLPQARWSTFTPGSQWSAPVGVLTGALDCEAIKAR